MTKANRKISTIAQAVKAYGGVEKCAKTFQVSVEEIDFWLRKGCVSRGYDLGMVKGLEARGYTVGPKVFGLARWRDLPGM